MRDADPLRACRQLCGPGDAGNGVRSKKSNVNQPGRMTGPVPSLRQGGSVWLRLTGNRGIDYEYDSDGDYLE